MYFLLVLLHNMSILRQQKPSVHSENYFHNYKSVPLENSFFKAKQDICIKLSVVNSHTVKISAISHHRKINDFELYIF